ncbi:MAG TPA: hypothetical protein VEU96_28370 [Bryobacteraceae bacterium]|nr:hypothetical protein [Bryobacteraceae bacterium]
MRWPVHDAGYDPTAFVDFFEKIDSLEKRQPGAMAKVSSTHLMTGDRIKSAQKNIQEILVAKPEYVVTTSEFNDVKARTTAARSTPKIQTGRASAAPPPHPRLRQRPSNYPVGWISHQLQPAR